MAIRTPTISTAMIDRTSADWSDEPSRFSGRVGRQALAITEEGIGALAVFFEAGSRTRPHLHAYDQVLICIDGEGVVATAAPFEDPDVVTIRPPDVVRIPASTWHWHGAKRSSPMTHVSILVQDAGDLWDGVDLKDWDEYREE
jgi:quercetin dioxygenase-like cupin family protein